VRAAIIGGRRSNSTPTAKLDALDNNY
jgi:hypothetical protein